MAYYYNVIHKFMHIIYRMHLPYYVIIWSEHVHKEIG